MSSLLAASDSWRSDLPIPAAMRQTGARYGCTTGITDSATIAAESLAGFLREGEGSRIEELGQFYTEIKLKPNSQ